LIQAFYINDVRFAHSSLKKSLMFLTDKPMETQTVISMRSFWCKLLFWGRQNCFCHSPSMPFV